MRNVDVAEGGVYGRRGVVWCPALAQRVITVVYAYVKRVTGEQERLQQQQWQPLYVSPSSSSTVRQWSNGDSPLRLGAVRRSQAKASSSPQVRLQLLHPQVM